MGGSVFGLHRRKRITFCEKFGGARLGRLKEGLGGRQKNIFPGEKWKNGRGDTGLDRTGVSGSRFLQKTAKHGLGAVKQGRSAANQCILAKHIQKYKKNEWTEACLDRTGVRGSCF